MCEIDILFLRMEIDADFLLATETLTRGGVFFGEAVAESDDKKLRGGYWSIKGLCRSVVIVNYLTNRCQFEDLFWPRVLSYCSDRFFSMSQDMQIEEKNDPSSSTSSR